MQRRSIILFAVMVGCLLLVGATAAAAQPNSPWSPVGAEILGEETGDFAGGQLMLSADGMTVTIGAPDNDGDGGDRSGHVRVFSNVAGQWTQVGNDIDGGPNFDQLELVTLSSNGRTLVVSGRPNAAGGGRTVLRIVENDDGDWRVTEVLEGSDEESLRGSGDLSADGRTLAVSVERRHDRESTNHVRIFQKVEGRWTTMGDLDGDSLDEIALPFLPSAFGSSLSLSADGSRLAVGSLQFTLDRREDKFAIGRVQVFELVDGSYVQVGQDLVGDARLNYFEAEVSLSADGRTLAASAPRAGAERRPISGNDDGLVKVFDERAGEWTQVGESLQHEARGDSFGEALALSADGLTLAVGAPRHDEAAPGAGHVRVFDRHGDRWLQVGEDFDGTAQNNRLGSTVQLSDDGSVLAYGAPMPGAGSGAVSVFSRAVARCGGHPVTIAGTAGDDRLVGTAGPDVITALQGNDTIIGLGGDDYLCGGTGNDVIIGGQGFDVLFGAQGNDVIYFSDGRTATQRVDTAGGRAFGGAGNDDIYGSSRWDRMQGGGGADRLFGYGGRDWIRAGAGPDHVEGGANIDDINGGNGNDRIVVEASDNVRGGAGAADSCVLLAGAQPNKLFSCERTSENGN